MEYFEIIYPFMPWAYLAIALLGLRLNQKDKMGVKELVYIIIGVDIAFGAHVCTYIYSGSHGQLLAYILSITSLLYPLLVMKDNLSLSKNAITEG